MGIITRTTSVYSRKDGQVTKTTEEDSQRPVGVVRKPSKAYIQSTTLKRQLQKNRK